MSHLIRAGAGAPAAEPRGSGNPGRHPTKASRLRACLIGVMCLVAAAACAKRALPPGDPAAAHWRPIVLPSADAIRVPPPPAPGSAEETRELQEMLAITRTRTEAEAVQARAWNYDACVRWNEMARELVAKHRAPHTKASRVYALVSVAQYDAIVAAYNNKYHHQRLSPRALDRALEPLLGFMGDPFYPASSVTAGAASAAVLGHLFPEEIPALEAKLAEQMRARRASGIGFPSDLTAGAWLGRQVAKAVIAHAEKDGAREAGLGAAPSPVASPHRLTLRHREPLDPGWGKVRPWLMSSAAQFRPGPPPASDSPEFQSALAEVKRLTEARRAEHQRLAALWADGLGSYAPAGRWNALAASLIRKYKLTELRAARVFALLNMALMDAGISAWDTKFHYLSQRPSQIDPSIVTNVDEPNSPSYTCSHAAFSGAGAGVLGFLFPEEKPWLDAKAEEAAMSRLYAGIQFRFEGDTGLAEGRAIADLARQRARIDGGEGR
jgi:hypothetical protein